MAFDSICKDIDLYPCIGMRNALESIRVNFGHESFKYDIKDHVRQQRATNAHYFRIHECKQYTRVSPSE